MFEFEPKCRLTTCCPEDLVVHKAFANRDQDWADVEGVLRKQIGLLNKSQIFEELRPLAELKEEESILSRLQEKLEKTGGK